MKTKLILITLAIFLSTEIFAQAPDLINYQAVARDAAGVPLINTTVNVQFDIRQSSSNGPLVYSETHVDTTNPFGLFTLQIGSGIPVSGTFAGINWSTGLYYLQVTVNGDAMTPGQLLSVPYALHANTASSGTPGANGHNGLSAITTEPAGANCPNGGYLVDVGVDDNDDGTLQTLEIDFSYYVCNGLDGAANVNDTSATNELQTLSISNDTVFLSNGGFIVLPPALGDNWGTQVVITSGANLTGDGTIATPLMVIDNDSSATNELQDLSITGNSVNITNGTGTQLSAIAPTTGDYLYWNGVNWVAQAPAANTDNQNLINGGKTGNQQTINIQNGTGVNFSVADEDSLTTNEIQQLTFTNPNLSLSLGGGTVNLSGLNTDAQTLSYTAATQALSISNGNSVTLDVNDADADPTNEYNTSFGINGTNLELVDGGNTFQVPLTGLGDADWTVGSGVVYNTSDLIGIGTLTPTYNLHIQQTLSSTTPMVAIINGHGSGDGALRFTGGATHYTIGSDVSDNSFKISNSSTGLGVSDRFTISTTGDVGIGTTTMFSRLDVAGQVTMRTGANNGYIPVSDANGTMTWTDPTTLALGSAWLYNGTDIFNGNSGNVGVGINVPENLLHLRNNVGSQFKIGHSNQPTAEWIYDVNASGQLNIINENFGTPNTVMTMTNLGQVGIGTTSPASQLQVEATNIERAGQFISNFASTNDKFGLYALAQGTGTGENIGVQGEAISATTNKAIVGRAFGGTNNWAGYFELGNVYIADNLGINTTTPNVPLHVEGNTQLNGVTQMNGTSGLSATLKVFGGLGAGVMYVFDGGGSKAFSVFSGGQVGIGAGPTGSTGILHIQDNDANTTGASGSHVNIQNLANATNTTAGIRFRTGGSTATNGNFHYKGAIYFEDGSGTNGEGDMIFAVNNAASSANVTTADAVMTITRNSTVGIGVAPSTLRKFHISTSANQYASYFNNTRSTGSNYGLYSNASSTSGTFNVSVYGRASGAATTNYGIYGYASGGGTNWSIYSLGNAFASGGTWQTSDAKLKTNVQNFEGALEKIKQLKIKTYNFKTTDYAQLNLPTQKQFGLLAQDLEQVFPEMVMEANHYLPNEDGTLSEETISIKAINYSQLIPVLTKAIQEQQEMIEELKKEIEEIKLKQGQQ